MGILKITKVGESNKNYIVNRLKIDLLHNLFVIYNLICEPKNSITYVAYDDNEFKGLLSVYKATPPMVRIDGEEDAVHRLLELIQWNRMILFCPPALLHVVKCKFPDANCYPEYQMYVVKGEEKPITPNLAEKLKPENAPLLAELYSSSPAEFQFSRSEQRCRELIEICNVYGIFKEDKLVSTAVSVKKLPEAGELIGVFTHPKYRGRGLGKMVVSAATEDALQYTKGVNLYVGADNKPAIRIYEKLGYRRVDEWFWVDIGTGLKP
ncbi:MAG: GNAT family N-acetyltransferase [Candidatus Bathyarchaeia archaeon]